ncbi:hypothetical protein VTK26DRAFT_6075 [Humicola hyalothermophila]
MSRCSTWKAGTIQHLSWIDQRDPSWGILSVHNSHPPPQEEDGRNRCIGAPSHDNHPVRNPRVQSRA